jgi:hypothetical protein
VGFNSTEPYSSTAENPSTTLGEARRFVLEKTVKMFSTQFYSNSPIFWGVSFEEIEGYGAITLGPGMREHTQYSLSDDYGVLKYGLHYPKPLRNALLNNVGRVLLGEEDYDATTEFTSSANDYSISGTDDGHRFSATILHELVHVIGFASLDCLRGCFPTSVSLDGHYNQFVFVEGDYNKTWNGLSLLEKEEAAMLEDILFFKGSDATFEFALNNLHSGITNNGIGLHSGVNDDGTWDGQSVAHLSSKITPMQLMFSAGADVNELGAAAYILCDIGWCRNEGFVADLSVTSANEVSIKPNIASIISFEIANLSSRTVEDIYFELEIPNDVDVIESGSTNGCKFSDQIFTCKITELLAEQYIDIDVTIISTEGQHIIDSKLYSKSFIVDPKGANNLNTLNITSEEAPFPTISLEETYNFTSGDSVIITPQYIDNSSDELSFDWIIISDDELTFDQDINTGVLSFTVPEITKSTTIYLKFTAQSKGRTIEKIITIYLKPEIIAPSIKPKKNSSGGIVNLLSIFSLFLFVVFRKKNLY